VCVCVCTRTQAIKPKVDTTAPAAAIATGMLEGGGVREEGTAEVVWMDLDRDDNFILFICHFLKFQACGSG